MRAETLVRCQQYDAAFDGFHKVYEASLRDDEGALVVSREIAPFQLLHDAECIEHAVHEGADAVHLERAAAWRELAEQLIGQADAAAAAAAGDDPLHPRLRRHASAALTASQRALLGPHGQPLPLPPSSLSAASGGGGTTTPEVWAGAATPAAAASALRSDIDWAAASRAYATERAIVIDDLLSPSTLAALQAYARHGAHFRTLRKGYLGAFPGDGTTHPLVLKLVQELTAAAPSIFASHALALWWIFKYDETNPAGIGIHADPAAVNINLWLTDDAACLEGGGLAIYAHVPALEQPTQAVNHEFKSAEAEGAFREELTQAGAVRTIPYKCNRAAIFVSDQYHESLPFRFAPGYANRRANLTLLFGDRWSPLGSGGGGGGHGGEETPDVSGATHVKGGGGDDGFDVFG